MAICNCGNYKRYGDTILGRTITHAKMHLHACVNCGVVPSKEQRKMHSSTQKPLKPLLGDRVAKRMKSMGADKVAKAVTKVTGQDCGCNKRQQWLNDFDKKRRGE